MLAVRSIDYQAISIETKGGDISIVRCNDGRYLVRFVGEGMQGFYDPLTDSVNEITYNHEYVPDYARSEFSKMVRKYMC